MRRNRGDGNLGNENDQPIRRRRVRVGVGGDALHMRHADAEGCARGRRAAGRDRAVDRVDGHRRRVAHARALRAVSRVSHRLL